MSRIGKAPIPIPSGVDVSVAGNEVTVKGPKGSLFRRVPADITVRQEDGQLLVERPDDEREHRALHGLTRSLVNNMVVGVTDGFAKELEIVGVGYRATAQGANRIERALGFSTVVLVAAAEGGTVERDLRSGGTGNKEAAARVGRLVADRAKAAGVARVVFDRGGFLYHGRVAALADAARKAGLEF